MKRIIMSAFTIFAMVAVVSGATVSSFTDQETVSLNTFSTGELDIRTEPTSAAIVAKDMVPGKWTSGHVVKVVNKQVSDVPAILKATVLRTGGDVDLYNSIEVKVTADSTEFYNGLLKDFTAKNIPVAVDPGKYVHLRFYLKLKNDADNSFKNTESAFDLVIDAEHS